MNYAEAKKRAKERYQEHLKKIELCKEVSDKIADALPGGWNIDIEGICFDLSIHKGNVFKNEEVDSGEFKFVCSLVEKAFPKIKLDRSAYANDDGKISFIKASDYFRKKFVSIEIEVIAYNPKLMPNCKIEWKIETVKRAIVSDECLGIGGKQ